MHNPAFRGGENMFSSQLKAAGSGLSALAFFPSVGATGPTTRPALSLFKFRAHSLYPVAPCVRFLGVLNPANPLITRERRNVLP